MPQARATNQAPSIQITRRNRLAAAIGATIAAVASCTTANAATNAPVAPANLTAGSARVLVPDGSSVSQAIGPTETRWFTFEVEAGRSYSVEAVDVNGDLTADAVGPISITASDGVSPVPGVVGDCTPTLAGQTPGLSPTSNGKRCLVHVNAPDQYPAPTQREAVYVGIGTGAGAGVNVRVRDATLFGRWSTRGYQFHIEFDNTTTDPVCAQALLYRESGYAFPADYNSAATVGRYQMTIPPNGSIKTVVPNGLLVGTDNRGTLRIVGCPAAGSNFVPGAVHVSTYAFNPVTNVYLFFYNWPSHNGSGANSW